MGYFFWVVRIANMCILLSLVLLYTQELQEVYRPIKKQKKQLKKIFTSILIAILKDYARYERNLGKYSQDSCKIMPNSCCRERQISRDPYKILLVSSLRFLHIPEKQGFIRAKLFWEERKQGRKSQNRGRVCEGDMHLPALCVGNS